MFINKKLRKLLEKIAKEYAEENGYFWGEETDLFIERKEFIFHKNYLVFNKSHPMGANYVVTIDKKELKAYEILTAGHSIPNAKNIDS